MSARLSPRALAAVTGAWLLYGLLVGSQAVLGYALTGERGPSWSRMMLVQLVPYLAWAVLTPVIVWLAVRFPLVRGQLLRHLPAHLAVALVLVLIASLTLALGGRWIDPGMARPLTPAYLLAIASNRLPSTLILYGVVLALAQLAAYQRALRERELRAARLEAQLAGARLQALTAQLQPHFLFNSLNTVAMLVRETGSRDALAVVLNLSEMLRSTLRGENEHTGTLDDELELVERYLEIERIRFDGRLRTALHVHPDARRARVPRLLLQPLVENAVRHGAGATGAGEITIRAEVRGDRLLVRVEDDGPGFSAPAPHAGSGVGLANTRARLAELYGAAASLRVADGNPGAVVTVELPLAYGEETGAS
ncbi:histidine kinase [Longimicrobium terrae]|uniref:histidine kinase n=1 Tax=Longimicrobium terrae TaxID=1639882 RepID=A0A841H6E7_9BACT|nr:two-component sensor histidine kinase [Longimicrobium terrae]MBB6073855.1 two-component sensor histidine kinase [Longimicrobium terrae]NNC32531.1 histidine kinase [Longimicrobium terrae]